MLDPERLDPMRLAQADWPSADAEGADRRKTMRALIVDDSRFVRGFLRGLLEEKGIECEEAGDGQAGLEHLHQRRPSIWRWWTGTCR